MCKRALDLFDSRQIQGGAFIAAEDDVKFLCDCQVVLVGVVLNLLLLSCVLHYLLLHYNLCCYLLL